MSAITSRILEGLPQVRHAFFTREAGESEGLYRGLNCGLGSRDAPAAVRANRAAAMALMQRPAEQLVTLYQVHSPDVVEVTGAWAPADNPHADAMVTTQPDVVLGILTADCVPVLLADRTGTVVGAAHAGWKGAIGGVVEAVVAAMEKHGAARGDIVAAIGPCIAQASYEVDAAYRARFVDETADNAHFFIPSARAERFLFDIGGYVMAKLAAAGVGQVERLPFDTVADEARFFSYRRATLRGEPDYGRGLSAIALSA